MSAYYGMSVSHIVDRVDSPLCRIWLDKMQKAKEKRRWTVERLDAFVKDIYYDYDDSECDGYGNGPTRVTVSAEFTAHYKLLLAEMAAADRVVADLKEAEECCCEYHRQR